MKAPRRLLAAACVVALSACDQAPTSAESAAPTTPSAAAATAQVAATTAGNAIEGQRVARRVGCTGCHGEDGGGRELWEEAGAFKLRSANLTEKRGLYDDAGLDALLTQGRTHDGHKPFGMPVFMLQRISADERRHVIAWVRGLPAVSNPSVEPTWMSAEVRGKLEDGSYPIDDHLPDAGVVAPAQRPRETQALGEYLAMTSCPECHGRDLRGWGPDDPAPSLVVAKAYSPEAFKRLMRTGITAAGTPSKTGFMSEVAKQRFAGMTDEEIAALKAWLDARAP